MTRKRLSIFQTFFTVGGKCLLQGILQESGGSGVDLRDKFLFVNFADKIRTTSYALFHNSLSLSSMRYKRFELGSIRLLEKVNRQAIFTLPVNIAE